MRISMNQLIVWAGHFSPDTVVAHVNLMPRLHILFGLPSLVALALLPTACSRSEPISRGESFDAGPVFAKDTPVLTHVFEIVNRSQRVLNILDEYHSCDCTKTEISTKKILPGEKSSITMRVNLYNIYGEKSVICNIKTGHPEVPDRRYTLNYTCYPEARIVPATIDFGSIALEDEIGDVKRPSRTPLQQQAWVEVYAAVSQDQSPSVQAFIPPEDLAVDLDLVPRRDVMPDGVHRFRYLLTLSLEPHPRPAQTYTRQLTIPFDGAPTASAQIVWKQMGTLHCEPSALAFGMADRGDTATRTGRVRVASQSGRAFRVLGVESATPSIVVTRGDSPSPFPTLAANSHELIIALTPSDEGGRVLTGISVIKTDDPRSPEIRLPWTMFFRHQEKHSLRADD
ncbi:DUF1573 domain-containing protein [Singulisphaera acidiphila]|uniref:DUF1573 domain-containing protein n=1 Tax=Singulisphaera acidiphila (strain ATCC BAA-1392 / DSM 18658 / VKM B-2454 / MOB10) TaxID=886293 RepID=L0DB57_SINAD|nr:DUF1573 domain-containing protein [Singulisphaera acidiphila]AGA26619.1 Protein of unknown function (DUF1573) [Singulisphaera acidiphila DSM 18658]